MEIRLRWKNDSIAALSPQAPTRPIDPVMPLFFNTRTNAFDRNCEPRSELSRIRFNSDRGTQYASAQITAFAAENGITRSMGLTGICWDCETLKTEFYYRRVWPTRDRATREVGAWIEDRYNRRRRHSSIGHVTPVDFELQYSSQAAEIQLAA